MKETRELSNFGGKVINAAYQIAEDNQVNLADLATLFPVVMAGPEGIGGAKLIGQEQAKIGPEEKQVIRTELVSQMKAVPEDDRDDWGDVFMGVLSGYRLGRRIGAKEAVQNIIDRIKNGDSIEDIEKELA